MDAAAVAAFAAISSVTLCLHLSVVHCLQKKQHVMYDVIKHAVSVWGCLAAVTICIANNMQDRPSLHSSAA